MKSLSIAAAFAAFAAPAFADGHASGDAGAGEQQFNRQCVACHVVQDPSGEILAGRNAKVGPNLFGVTGRTAGTVAGFRYGDGMIALGEAGGIWTEDNFAGFVQNPSNWLRETLEDRRARTKMAYRVRNAGHATDIYAFLATFGDQAEIASRLEAGRSNPLNQ